jgi:hypothetical protein
MEISGIKAKLSLSLKLYVILGRNVNSLAESKITFIFVISMIFRNGTLPTVLLESISQ